MNIARATEMYRDEGRSILAIAHELGCSTHTVRRHFKATGVMLEKRNRHRWITAEYVTLAQQMRAAGEGWQEISAKIGFSASALHRAVAPLALTATLAREAALQARLDIADQRIDELETQLQEALNPRIAA